MNKRNGFAVRHAVLAVLLCWALCTAAGCSGHAGKGVQDITPVQLQAMAGEPDVVILDVREPAEFQDLPELPGSVNIPLAQLESRLPSLDKEKRYVLVCRSGNRSAQATGILSRNGFENLYNLQGGMKNYWANAPQEQTPGR